MSTSRSLNYQDWKDWLTNLRVFATPLVLIYLVPILGLIEQPNHTITLGDFAFTQVMLGASIAYILNAIIGLLRKYYQAS